MVGIVAVAVLALSGCIGLPSDGPVVDVDVGDASTEDRVSSVDARPPQPGASPREIVEGFLEAMLAWPISTNVAEEFLTEDAAEEWNPDRTVIYTDLGPTREDGSTVSVPMVDATLLDESGGWRGPLPRSRSTLHFQLIIEDNEFRILDPMNALFVRSDRFQQRYQQVSLYNVDPTGEVLVPEPVFMPVGKTFATSLVTALLAGPPERLNGVVQTYIPPQLSVGLSVPVIDGVAILDLQGEAPPLSPVDSELMLAQLAATLRQDPAINAIRVSIGGEVIDPPGAETEYDVTSADAFDAAGTGSAGVLYGIQRGRVVAGTVGDLRAVDGPFGRGRHSMSTVSVAPVGDRVAIVTGDRREAQVAPLRAPVGSGRKVEVVAEGTALTRPAWDAAGRLWLLDRTADGARLLVSDDGGRAREVPASGLTGADVRKILVSRDGTRLIALVEGRRGEVLVAARVLLDPLGRVAQVIDASMIRALGDRTALDLVWTGEAEVAVLAPARPGELFEVLTVAADGSTFGVDTLPTMVTGPIDRLAGEPYAGTPVYAVAPDAFVDIRTGVRTSVSTRVREIGYAG